MSSCRYLLTQRSSAAPAEDEPILEVSAETPGLFVPDTPPPVTRPARTSSRKRSAARRGTPVTITKPTSAARTRTTSNQFQLSPPPALDSHTPAPNDTLPTHVSTGSVNGSPVRSFKRRRLDAAGDATPGTSTEAGKDLPLAEPDVDSTPIGHGKSKAKESVLPVNDPPTDATEESSTQIIFPIRALSQPPWSKKRNQGTAAQGVAGSTLRATRRTRAGSAGPSGTTVAPVGYTSIPLTTVGEMEVEELPIASSSSQRIPPSLSPIDPLPLPRSRGSPSNPPFISYPLPTDPVKPLQPLTQSDSGSEFFAGISKQGYQTDWHDGVVFDDPIDAESVRRAATLAVHAELGGGARSPLFSDDENDLPDVMTHDVTMTSGSGGLFGGIVDLGLGSDLF